MLQYRKEYGVYVTGMTRKMWKRGGAETPEVYENLHCLATGETSEEQNT